LLAALSGAMTLLAGRGGSLLAAAAERAAGSVRGRTTEAELSERGLRRMVLFYTAEVHGTVEPCGCTSDPLGDVSRLAALMADTRRELGGAGVALVDAGGLLYPEGGISIREQPSADVRAEFMASEFLRLGLIGAGIGETELVRGTTHVRPPRLASNVEGAGALVRPPRVERVGDIDVGVLGVADPQVAATLATAVHGQAGDPVAAVKRDVTRLRAAGAELVVLLAPVDKVLARKLAREAAPDVIVLGKRVGRGMSRLEQSGATFLVAPQDELQQVGRLEIVLRGRARAGTSHSGASSGPRFELRDAGGPEADRLRLEEIARTRARLEASLGEWAAHPAPAAGGKSDPSPPGATSDPRFVAQKKQELGELTAEQKRLAVPWQPPAAGSYVVNALVPMRRKLRRDAATVTAMKALDRRIAALNLRNAAPPPVAEEGRAHFVGNTACSSCHASAETFWKRTVHAHAWKTLVDGGKQADYKCVGCHVTGFGQVGGSSLGFTRKLESVQCETCHGPGSLHVAGEGNEDPLAIRRDTPETVCLGCHTEQHSDTFQYVPYLRDIVGTGHGGARRTALGPGATGHELRTAALARAKLAAASPAEH
jgi:hypothetical protein